MVETQAYPDGTLFAICILNPDGDSNVKGVVKFIQEPGKKVRVSIKVTGLSEGLHEFNVHQFGKTNKVKKLYKLN